MPRTKAFVGRWLIGPDERVRTTLQPGFVWAVAQTQRGRFVLYWFHVDDETQSGLEIHMSLEALVRNIEEESEFLDADEKDFSAFITLLKARVDPNYVQELDI
jgi:hypothetical protein